MALASPYVVERTGIALSLFEFDWQELVLIPGLVVLASLVGFLPALSAYRTDVAKALGGESVDVSGWLAAWDKMKVKFLAEAQRVAEDDEVFGFDMSPRSLRSARNFLIVR